MTQLLYLPPDQAPGVPSGAVPAFFAGLDRFYCYYYDGRSNHIVRSVGDILEEAGPGSFHVHMLHERGRLRPLSHCAKTSTTAA